LISLAHAAAPAAQPDPLMSFLPLIVIFVLFYFMLIRPQMKRAKEQRKMLEGLDKGDEVATSAGILGRVTKVGEQYVHMDIADGVTVVVQKSTVQTLLPKGTIKAL
jgi:preprotein translocase subunit YajC